MDFTFSPIFRTIDELRHFHRPLFSRLNYSRTWLPVNLSKMDNEEKNSFRKKSDLTARSGEILFFEYSEQYPVLLNEVGMFSRIRTYLRPVNLSKKFLLTFDLF